MEKHRYKSLVSDVNYSLSKIRKLKPKHCGGVTAISCPDGRLTSYCSYGSSVIIGQPAIWVEHTSQCCVLG